MAKILVPMGLAVAANWLQNSLSPQPTSQVAQQQQQQQQQTNFDFTPQPGHSMLTSILSFMSSGGNDQQLASPDIPRTLQFKTVANAVGNNNGGALTRFPIGPSVSSSQSSVTSAPRLSAASELTQSLLQSMIPKTSSNGGSVSEGPAPGAPFSMPFNFPIPQLTQALAAFPAHPADTELISSSVASTTESEANGPLGSMDGGLLVQMNEAAKAMGIGSLNDIPLDGVTKIVLDNIESITPKPRRDRTMFPGMQFEMQTKHGSTTENLPTVAHNVFDDSYSPAMLRAMKKGPQSELPPIESVGVPFLDIPGQN